MSGITSGNIIVDSELYTEKVFPQQIKEAMVNVYAKGLTEFLQKRGWQAEEIAVCLGKALEIMGGIQKKTGATKIKNGHDNLTESNPSKNVFSFLLDGSTAKPIAEKIVPKKPKPDNEKQTDINPAVCRHGRELDLECMNCLNNCPKNCKGFDHCKSCVLFTLEDKLGRR